MALSSIDHELSEVIDRLAGCGQWLGGAGWTHHAPLPKRSRIAETLSLYRTLLFPQLVEHGGRERDRDWLVGQACTLHAMLATEIQWALQQGSGSEPAHHHGPDDHQRLATEIVRCLPAIKLQLLEDAQAAVAGDPACSGLAEVVICYPGFQAIAVHRLAHELYRRGLKLLARMMSEWVHSETGIDIHPGAQIGRHFFIDHGTGVVIGETCVVGQHVRIYQGVTLGALSFARDEAGNLVRDTKRHPTIEDHVVIYANATILGGRTSVGHHSIVGASVWLAQSVAPFTTVVMEQPKLRFRNQTPTAFDQPPDYQI